jgi:flavin-dependent dehydrogenase
LPRDKVCAGGVSAGARSLLGFEISHLVKSETDRATIAFSERRRKVFLPVTVGCTVERREFDYFLAEKAAGAGAKIMDCQKVISVSGAISPEVRTEKETYHCDFAILAAGSVSGINPRLRFETARRFALGVTSTLPREKVSREEFLFDFAAVPCGYGWVFPKGDKVSIGVYSLRVRGRKLLSHFLRFLSRCTDSRERVRLRVAPIALPSAPRRFGERILPVGDSFGAADPFMGKGVYGALKTAILAADAIISSPQNAAASYLNSAGAHLDDMLFSFSLSRLFYSQQEFVYETLMRLPAVLTSFSAAVADITTYRGTFVRSLAGLGVLPFPFPEERRSS